MTFLFCRNDKIIEGVKWKRMGRKAVKEAIIPEVHTSKTRVQHYYSCQKYYKSKLSRCEFLSLIWHEIDASRLLTPKNESRAVRDVAERMIERRYTFQSLSRNQGLPLNQHDPEWFHKCWVIDRDFDFDKFRPIWLVIANDDEKSKAPASAKFYIYDGCHRSLVLGKRLLTGESKYEQQVKVILISPRPSD